MREEPGNELHKVQLDFNPKLREAVNRGKCLNVEDYIAVISEAKTMQDVKDPIKWVGFKERQAEIEEEEER